MEHKEAPIKVRYLIILLIFWGLIWAAFIGKKEYTRQTGREVILKTVPVDPRDLFRGDYVILRYDISRVHIYNEEFNDGDEVYVMLEHEKKYPQVIGASKTKPDNSTFFLKGKVTSASPDRINVKYGIESYFIPEGTGKAIEQKIGKIDVKINVDKFGNAIIKELMEDGKKLKY